MKYKPTQIRAKKGSFLTQAKDVDLLDRFFAKIINLSSMAKVEDYKSITIKEARLIMQQQDELLKKKYEEEMK